MHLRTRDGQHCAEHDVIAPRGKVHKLPSAGEIGGQFGGGKFLDQDTEQTFAQTMSEVELLQAPP